MNQTLRLRKHADFQRVYKTSRKQHSRQLSFFFALREDGAVPAGPRVGFTIGKVMGKAVDRNRIRRRLREAVRRRIGEMAAPVDIILHPRRRVLEMEFGELEREVGEVFATVRAAVAKRAAKVPEMGANSEAAR